MHIAIICKTFLKGGAEKQALILTKLLSDRGIDVILVNWYGEKVDPRNLKFIRDNSFRYYPMSGSYFKKLVKFQKIVKHDEITVMISYLTLANFVSGFTKIFKSNIVTIGGIRNEKLPYYKFLFEKLIHNHLNNATVFNNYSAKSKFETRGFEKKKIYVIQNAIESQSNQFSQRNSNGEIKIVTVGRFVKQKDYETALRSFSNLLERKTNKKFRYLIVGYGPLEKEIRELASRLRIEDKTDMYINPPNVQEILRRSDIFLSTSLFEGVSNSIMEAMVAGLPVIATDVGDNSYLVRNGHNGFLVPCRDINAITEKLEYLAESEDIRNIFGMNSIKVIDSEFSKERFLECYLELFEKLKISV